MSARTIDIVLDAKLAEIVEEAIRSGDFPTPDAVVAGWSVSSPALGATWIVRAVRSGWQPYPVVSSSRSSGKSN